MSDSTSNDRPPPTPEIDKDQIREALELIVSPEEVFEIRIIGDGPPKVRAFDGHDLDMATQWVANHERGARGVYVLMNPLPADFPKDGPAANDKSILRRRFILIDVDSKTKPKDGNATNAEKAKLRRVAERIITWLLARGWPRPILIDSGNGWHLLFRVDLPADDDGLVHQCLETLANLFNDDDAEIDQKVANPSRITKLPGTVVRKGDHTNERPHRRAAVVDVPDEIKIVPRELLEALAAEVVEAPPERATYSSGSSARAEIEARVRAYLAKVPPAVSGQNGHDTTFGAACKIVRGFDLDEETAFAFLWEWNLACDPPWTERDLRHKIREARTKGREPLGYLLDESRDDGFQRTSHKRSKNVDETEIRSPDLISFSDIEPLETEWLWAGRIPLGCITLLAGAPGQGKSYVTASMAGIITTGSNWPDGDPCELGDVLFVTSEDDPARVTLPRLIAHGAVRNRCRLLKGVKVTSKNSDPFLVAFTLQHIDILREAAKRMPNLRLIVLDPIGSFIGGRVDSDKDNKVREVLQPLAALAQELNIAVVVVVHHRKSSGDGTADDKVLGSIGFVGLARSVLHVAPVDELDKDRRALVQGKTNFGQRCSSLEYRIQGTPATVKWSADPIDIGADELLSVSRGDSRGKRSPGPKPAKRDAAEETLRGILTGKRMRVTEVMDQMKQAGFSVPTIQRAANAADVHREWDDSGCWYWSLPDLSQVFEKWTESDTQPENLRT
jgi:putative DNA primase/helicase